MINISIKSVPYIFLIWERVVDSSVTQSPQHQSCLSPNMFNKECTVNKLNGGVESCGLGAH